MDGYSIPSVNSSYDCSIEPFFPNIQFFKAEQE